MAIICDVLCGKCLFVRYDDVDDDAYALNVEKKTERKIQI